VSTRLAALSVIIGAHACAGDDTSTGRGDPLAPGDPGSSTGDTVAGDSGQQSGDPGAGDPDTGDPDTGDPGTGDPGAGDPGAGDPGAGDPGAGDPGAGDPGVGDPGVGDPGAGDPGTADPGAGSYTYDRLTPTGFRESVAVAFHPNGDYFLVLDSVDTVWIVDAVAQTAVVSVLHAGAGNTSWSDVTFDPDGSYALLTGSNTDTGQAVVWHFDHAAWSATKPSTTGVFTELTAPATIVVFGAVEFSGPGANPVVVGRTSSSPYSMWLVELDAANGFTSSIVTEATSSAGCEDLAYVNNEWGDPGILIVCGFQGYDAFFWTEVGGVPELRTDLGFNNLGNTSRVVAHPSGAYALPISWSGDRICRFEDGVMLGNSSCVWFPTRRLWNIAFDPLGKRALIIGRRMNIGGNEFAPIMEFRHDFFSCPAPLTTCDVTEVSIPDFGGAPWSAPINTQLWDIAWRPGCDGGVIVGGVDDYGLMATFQRDGGVACW